MQDERFVYKVVEMYYKRGLSQLEIGKKLNVSRTTVFRALERAREEGYVQVIINRPKGLAISKEEQLEQKYNLKEAIVSLDGKSKSGIDGISYFASDYILRSLHNDMILALSRGSTLQKAIEYMESDLRLNWQKYKNIKIVPLMGSTNFTPSQDTHFRFAYTNNLIDRVGTLLNCNGYHLLAPLMISTQELRDALLNDKSIKDVINMAKEADIAVTGIGSVGKESIVMNEPELSEQAINEIKKDKAVGEIMGHVYDRDGHIVAEDYDNHLMSLDMESFKQIPVRVGIAGGADKKEGILGALKGKFINVLITDEETADYLLSIKN